MTRVSRSIALTGSLVLLTVLGGTATAAASQRTAHHPAPQSVRAGTLPALLDEVPGLGWVATLLQPGVHPCDH